MRYPITLEVKEIRGTCPLHQVDDQVTIFNGCLEGKVCLPTLSRYIELLSGLCFGMPAADEATLACPDNGNVIFQLRRDSTRYWKDALSPLGGPRKLPPTIVGYLGSIGG